MVGVGSTPYYKRGESWPQTPTEMACKATLAALDDAGLTADDLDGFALYSGGFDTSLMAQVLGIPEVRFTAALTGGGGGAAGSVGLAAAAVTAGMADVVVSVMTLSQGQQRFGSVFARKEPDAAAAGGPYSARPSPETDFMAPSGLAGPGQLFGLLFRRHMHQYGTKREHLAEVAMSTRANAVHRPTARMRTPMTVDDYFNAPMIADPLCLLDFCLETDGAVAVITTSADAPAISAIHRPMSWGRRTAATAVGGRRSLGWECQRSTSRRPAIGRLPRGSTGWLV